MSVTSAGRSSSRPAAAIVGRGKQSHGRASRVASSATRQAGPHLPRAGATRLQRKLHDAIHHLRAHAPAAAWKLPAGWASAQGPSSCLQPCPPTAAWLPATLLPATLLPATLLPATLLPATLLPATLLPATLLPATLLPATLLQPTLVAAAISAASDGSSISMWCQLPSPTAAQGSAQPWGGESLRLIICKCTGLNRKLIRCTR